MTQATTFTAQAATDPQAEAVVPESTAPKQEQPLDQGVALVVGERAFASMEDVKTKIINSDRHISTLEAENAALRAWQKEAEDKLSTSKSIEDVLNSKEGNKDEALTPEQIKLLVNETITSDRHQSVAQANSALCQQQVRDAYGNNFIVKMQEVASEIGLSMEEVDKMAEGNPKLFQRTFLPATTQVKETPNHSHSSTIRTSNFNDTPSVSIYKPVLSLSSKERTAQFMRQLEAMQQ